MTLPTFIVVGAGRSGTTSLHSILGQHPDVFMCPVKSPNFFVSHLPLPAWESPEPRRMAAHWTADRRAYEGLFTGADDAGAVGEVSPVYLQARDAPRAIAETCPGARIVAVLRDPAERAYAHFLGRRRDGLEPRSDFEAIVDEELSHALPDEVTFGSYVGCGRYHHFLQGYVERFPADRIRVYLYEDLVSDPAALIADLFAFVGVDPDFAPDLTERRGATGTIQNRVLRSVWTRSVALRRRSRPLLPAAVRGGAGRLFLRHLERPPLDPSVRATIVAALRDDVAALRTLIGRDLSRWLA
jgi:hypothetical protein